MSHAGLKHEVVAGYIFWNWHYNNYISATSGQTYGQAEAGWPAEQEEEATGQDEDVDQD